MKLVHLLFFVIVLQTTGTPQWRRRPFFLVRGSSVQENDDSSHQRQEIEHQLSQSSLSNSEQAELYVELAGLHQTADSFHEAIKAFQQAIRLYDDDDSSNEEHVATLYSDLGETYLMLLLSGVEDASKVTNWETAMHDAWEQSKRRYRSAMQHQEDPLLSLQYASVCLLQGMYCTEHGEPMRGWELIQEGQAHCSDPSLPMFLSEEEMRNLQHNRLAAWTYASKAANVLRKFDAALQALQPVMEYYRGELEHRDTTKDDPMFYHDYAGQCLGQGDYYLQLGQYNQAKESYAQAMQLYQKHCVEHPNAPKLHHTLQRALDVGEMEAIQEQILLFQGALKEYDELLQEEGEPAKFDSSHESALGFTVGDLLHGRLASLYTSASEPVLAEVHWRQALLFFTTIAPDNKIRKYLAAELHFNLSQSLWEQGKYEESMKQRILACQLYQEILGEGVNPLMTRFDGNEIVVSAEDTMM
ncbi:hypothetical protein FisN_26Hu128 [Fistulifera solaris]|uniref:Tetratricopeptide repeat protein n=1 Tax=Fistulifera solaris TaxID=1519565 RepID=A0A1Z5JXS9_FISSO|nr:hypothetical protein FisN_26Hu128 [Fistulifera solaris]|eukprot:GAX18827.1 hypothetical protein FisN_26Hu128 [Fistulifera solaris]